MGSSFAPGPGIPARAPGTYLLPVGIGPLNKRGENPATPPSPVLATDVLEGQTHPAFTRRGVGRLILSLCEAGAASEGFTSLELMATLSGRPLYEAAGFEAVEKVEDSSGGTPVPLIKMRKAITS